MALHIDQAAEEFKRNIDLFVEAYKKKHAAQPNEYPLEMPDDNAGIWGEFMFDFHNTGNV
ncbi:hypothetical protein [Undibacterium oligocarboniphilum]|uniref:Uncharacterized protein n=1 Tax=Undibacterium oligocarboniphilum TaxID=666702 RepID=A0A850QNF6_9BURK|nr:hypothetical protein [Undibacterium oligocarboniphilum]MBC3871511.1 hypothetical protein [Undibacterium oligocarboniphilum]NVO78913.1 hypothetical protein [Undibacterium oligocarboniphilum]